MGKSDTPPPANLEAATRPARTLVFGTSMTDGDALHAAILATPEDDTPRLVYADWLDENHQPERAEFIRLQCQISQMKAHEASPWQPPVVFEIRAREKALLAAYGDEWLAPLRQEQGPLQSSETHGQFRRGFVEIVWMPATWFQLRAEALFARVPVRELRITQTTSSEFIRLMHHPLMGRLAGLDLSNRNLGDSAVDLITWSPFTSALQVLRLRGCAITDEGAAQLAQNLECRLRELDVSFNPISRSGLELLRERFGDAVRFGGV